MGNRNRQREKPNGNLSMALLDLILSRGFGWGMVGICDNSKMFLCLKEDGGEWQDQVQFAHAGE